MPEPIELVVARLFDFFGRRTPWHRRLWSPGLLSCLEEVEELSTIVQEIGQGADQVLSYRRYLVKEVSQDVGFAEPQRGQLIELLQQKQNLSPSAVLRLRHLREQATISYLAHWNAAVTGGAEVPAERMARSLASTLLDAGFSPSGLHRWLTAVHKSGKLTDLGQLVDEARRRLELPTRTWEAFVPVQQIPFHGHPPPANYLTAAQSLDQLPAELSPRLGIRVNGALRYEVDALDAAAAATRAGDLIRRLAARVTVGLPGEDEVVAGKLAWIRRLDGTDVGTWQPLREVQRSVEVVTLYRNELVFASPDVGTELDEALELLAVVEMGSPGASLASAWATIESLLCGPTDLESRIAASRMAAIVTGSLPRAELTPLGHGYQEEHDDELAAELAACGTNLEMAVVMERAIRRAEPAFSDVSDQAAVLRLRSFVNEPAALRRVQTYLEQAFLRLQRLRNRVMHGGSAESAVTPAVIGTIPALLGAGVDRIVHGAFSADPRLTSLELAARADVNVRQACEGQFAELARLLEPPV
jgi:hypothetical protein